MHRITVVLAILIVAVSLARAEEPATTAPPNAPATTPPPAAPAEDKPILETVQDELDSILAKLNLTFYGHIKLDMSHDSTETNFGDTAFFVKNYKTGERDDEVNIHARHTRFGVNWKGPEFEGINATAKIEIDFLGKAKQRNTETAELQSAVRLRHAYMHFDFGDGWAMRAGQTWDVFAPLNAKTLNTMVLWGQGNFAYRRPMLAFWKKFGFSEKSSLTLKLAIARPVARDNEKLDSDFQDDGEASGVPDFQGHAGMKFPLFPCKKPTAIGIGGFIGWRQVGGDTAKIVDEENYKSYGVALDLLVPILDNLELLGEVWVGTALDGYRGGVWQSYVAFEGDLEVIRAWGAFANLVWKPWKRWMVSIGAGIDNPKDDDFEGQNGRYTNRTAFANIRYSFYKGATVGVEYQWMNTEWQNHDYCVNHRVQVSFMLKF